MGPLGPKKERYLKAIARRESRLEKDMKAQEARDVPTSADDLLTMDDVAVAMEEEPRTQRGRGAFLADTDYELTGADKENIIKDNLLICEQCWNVRDDTQRRPSTKQ